MYKKIDLYPSFFVLFTSFLVFYAYINFDNSFFIYTLIAISIPFRVISAMILHNCIHTPIFKSNIFNEVFYLFIFLLSGISSRSFALTHYAHHKYYIEDMNKEPAKWKYSNGTVMNRLIYTLRYMCVHTYEGIKIGISEKSTLFRKSIIQRSFFVFGLIILFLINSNGALYVYFIPMLITRVVFVSMTYDDHAYLDNKNPFLASSSKTNKLLNMVTFNSGFHMAHHDKPSLHWSKLMFLHNELKDKPEFKTPAPQTFINKIFE